MFGSLGKELRKGIIPAIEHYESMNEEMLKESVSDFEPFISELLKYQRTTPIIHSLINFKGTHFKSPIVLPQDSLPQLKLYTKVGLTAVDMRALDNAMHLFYHGFPNREMPYSAVSFI